MWKNIHWSYFRTFHREEWYLLAVACLGLASLFLGGAFLWQSYRNQPSYLVVPEAPFTCEPSKTEEKVATRTVLAVDISGAVVHPGIYELSSGSRVQDVVLMAGGFQAKANKEYLHRQLNLSQKLTDQAKYYIPFEDESWQFKAENPDKSVVNTKNAGINVNSASQSELEALPGVGEKRAQGVVENRPYTDLPDFQARSGLSAAILNDMQEKDLEISF